MAHDDENFRSGMKKHEERRDLGVFVPYHARVSDSKLSVIDSGSHAVVVMDVAGLGRLRITGIRHYSHVKNEFVWATDSELLVAEVE